MYERRDKSLEDSVEPSLYLFLQAGNDSNWSAAIFLLSIGARQGATTLSGGDPLSRHVISFDLRNGT